VAIKALGIAHKSDAKAVRLNLHDATSVRLAAEDLVALGNGLLVERMIEGAVMELIVGVTRDTECGLLMTVGAGGILVELLQDNVSMLLPVTGEDVRRALRSLRLAPVLDGYRGAPAADVDALVDAVLAIARFACDNADRLEELDVNPLMVCAKGRGAVAADVLLRMRGE
jgi:acyl-CoA synthetase (NDP forming)